MFYKVKEVKTLPDYNLQVQFQTGENKIYDVKPLFNKHEEFKALQLTYKLFEQVKVDSGGYGIYWNEYIDIACNELYFNGIQIETDLTDEEKAIIEEGDRQFKEHPEDFVSLESLLQKKENISPKKPDIV